MLLGDVGQREEVRERARDRNRGGDRHVAQLVGELLERRRVAAVRPLCQRANALHALEERVAFARPEHVAEQLAQEPHILA